MPGHHRAQPDARARSRRRCPRTRHRRSPRVARDAACARRARRVGVAREHGDRERDRRRDPASRAPSCAARRRPARSMSTPPAAWTFRKLDAVPRRAPAPPARPCSGCRAASGRRTPGSPGRCKRVEGVGTGLGVQLEARPWRRRTTARPAARHRERGVEIADVEREREVVADVVASRVASCFAFVCMPSDEIARRARRRVARTTSRSSSRTRYGARGLAEVRGADPDRARAREQHLDRVGAGRAHHRCR